MFRSKKLFVVLAVFIFSLGFALSVRIAFGATPTIYVTVDDGPLGGVDNLLSVLEQENVRATFFMVGEHILSNNAHKAAFMRAKNSPYVLLANHSYSHAHSHYQHFYSSDDGVLRDMEKNNRIIGLSKAPFYARLPGRDVFRIPELKTEDPFVTMREDEKERIDFDELFQNGFFLYGWDLEWAHETSGWPIQSVEHLMEQIRSAFNNSKTEIPGHLVLLMHDQMFLNHLNGRENFSNFIRALKQEGYNIETIDNYPGNF
ncbi:MAG: polysaccharide deacetylase family protein [Alphaproteobacteria bacterium]|nr:polysaccharide deacetylase family protein [Alphaproteobacteria bacterium]